MVEQFLAIKIFIAKILLREGCLSPQVYMCSFGRLNVPGQGDGITTFHLVHERLFATQFKVQETSICPCGRFDDARLLLVMKYWCFPLNHANL